MSIKDNILYGNESASDIEVRQAAEQANALSFIEGNTEDLGKVELKMQLETNFESFISNKINEYPNLGILT